MPHSDQLKLIDMRSLWPRLSLIVPVALALLFAWYGVRLYVGGVVAEYAPQMNEGQIEAAEEAVRLAPDDPWTHRAVARIKKESFLPADWQEAVHQYEEAARLSPYDYRIWIELGLAREEVGDRAAGEKALRRAVELAPNYAFAHWYLGNLLLRAGRGDEAFAELRRAADENPKLRPQLFNVAFMLYGQDIGAIGKAVGDSPGARADFASFLAENRRLEDALAIWASLSQSEKKGAAAAGDMIVRALLNQRSYRAALGVLSDMIPGVNPKGSQLIDGGFEGDITVRAGDPFSWQIKTDPQAQVAIDESKRHGGQRSLRILFRVSGKLLFNNISQTVVVEPSTQYRLEYYVRAEDLKSGTTPVVQITDANSMTGLVTSPPAPSGTYDWQPVTINFKTAPNTEAITVSIARADCGDEVCPIFGKLWYDDFNLQSVSGTTGPRDNKGNKRGD